MTNDRVIAYIPLHYGAEYLFQAIQSVAPFVEKIMVFYTNRPSYGFGTDAVCPDSEETLRDIAMAASDKVIWMAGYWGNEGSHRAAIYNFTYRYSGVVTFDADEVFDQNDLSKAIEYMLNGKERYYGVNGYVNFWKTFDWEVKDFYRPIRFINLKNQSGEGVVDQKIFHFSCCQRDEIMRYKYLVHGHADELKRNWLNEFYFAWTVDNKVRFLHPTSNSIWGDAIPFDKNTLPESLLNHPNFNKTI